MKRLVVVLAAAVATHGAAGIAQAIPAFADRYGVECHFCHRGFPKLTKAGERFKERGFRMENEDAFDFGKWAESVPLRLRASYNHFFVEGEDNDSDSAVFKLLSAGNLGSRISYWADDSFFVPFQGDDKFQHLKPDNLWLRIDLMEKGKLYLRGGRVELDIPFTQVRTPHLFSYEVYSMDEGTDIATFRDGLELGGYGDTVHWSATLADGTSRSEDDEFDPNAFLRVFRRFGGANRIGAFGYLGRETDAAVLGAAGAERTAFLAGVDLDSWFGAFNLYGVGAFGSVEDTVTAGGVDVSETRDVAGAFVQGDYHARDDLALTARVNVVRRPNSAGANETFSSVWPGVKFLIRERARLSFEYGFQNKDRGNIGALQAEVVF